MPVPLIDLSLPDEENSLRIRDACISYGFFFLSGHGITNEFMSQVFSETQKLFSLPLHEKQKMLADENNRGWTPFREETLDPVNQMVGDTKEGFYFGREVPKDSDEAKKPLHGPNQWPSASLLPHLKLTYENYIRELTALGFRLLGLVALSLDLPSSFFHSFFQPPMTMLRPLHYEACISKPAEGILGAGAHTDYGMLTILATDSTPGLQIYIPDQGGWINVAPIPGTFIVNLGDMLERWTNQKYKSTLHRVVTPNVERFSIAFFFEPAFDAIVDAQCLPNMLGPDEIPRYPSTTAGQHLLNKYKATHAGFDANRKETHL